MATADIILLGEYNVGKTTLLKRFETGEFRESRETTEGELHCKNIILENTAVTLNIYDTAGSERYRSVTRSYYRKGEGVLLVYDVTNAESFYKLSSWLCEMKKVNEKVEALIAGNKNEDPTKKAVNASVVKRFAREESLEYIEVSAKTGQNVQEAFLHLAKKILVGKGILPETCIKSLPTFEDVTLSRTDSLASIPPTRNSIIDDDDIIKLGASTKILKRKKRKCC